jgi:hypothetical protein
VAKGTAITVKLYFASRCSCTPGSRLFHINIDGVRKVTNFDPNAAAGGNEIGIGRNFDVVSDGSVNIDLIRAVGHPNINGIEIFRRPAPAPTGNENKTFTRTYDGNTTVGGRTEITLPAFAWGNARQAFMVGDTLFIGHGATFYRAPFNGTTFGPAVQAVPYSDPKWDVVLTSSGPVGQTYKGARPDYFAEMPSVTGQFFYQGKLYYTLAGRPQLFWRWFSPDSGIVGATRNSITAPISLTEVAGMFVNGNNFYVVSRNTGALHRMAWSDSGVPGGTPVQVSGLPQGVDWRAKATFVGP